MRNENPFTRQNRVAEPAAGRFQETHAPSVETHAKLLSPFQERIRRAFAATNSSPAFWSKDANGVEISQCADSSGGLQIPAAPLIYAVDDMPCLTELYALLLEATGHIVRTFSDRKAALAALRMEKPALLITDHRNPSMPTDRFLQACVAAHSRIRILMATGFGFDHAWYSPVMPDRFLQKPFTPQDLLREVKAALAEASTGFGR